MDNKRLDVHNAVHVSDYSVFIRFALFLCCVPSRSPTTLRIFPLHSAYTFNQFPLNCICISFSFSPRQHSNRLAFHMPRYVLCERLFCPYIWLYIRLVGFTLLVFITTGWVKVSDFARARAMCVCCVCIVEIFLTTITHGVPCYVAFLYFSTHACACSMLNNTAKCELLVWRTLQSLSNVPFSQSTSVREQSTQKCVPGRYKHPSIYPFIHI